MTSESSTGQQAGTGGETADDESTQPRSPEEIQAEIEQTRAQLGESVDALHAKLDVKSRAQDRVAETKRQASAAVARGKDGLTDEQGSLRPAVPAAAGVAAVLVVVGVVIWRRRR